MRLALTRRRTRRERDCYRNRQAGGADNGLSYNRWHVRCTTPLQVNARESTMSSRNVGSKRQNTRDPEVPAELAKREAQDRAGSRTGSGRAKSPVDATHVDAPARQENARGHRRKKSS